MIITILRKPLEGSVADNVLKHGCGALNIDATRIKGKPWKWGTQTDIKGGGFGSNRPSDGNILRKNVEGGFNGRWPANFILTHLEGCELKGSKKIKEGKANKDKGGSFREVGLYEDGLKTRAVDHFQGEEEIEDWACVKDCPIRKLDLQSGQVKGNEKWKI
jgi:hypothetical protein